eukprot:4579694-Amphidinium_carterae.1
MAVVSTCCGTSATRLASSSTSSAVIRMEQLASLRVLKGAASVLLARRRVLLHTTDWPEHAPYRR